MSAGSRIEELRRKLQENPRRYFAPLANELRVAGALDEAVALCRAHLPRHPEHLSGFIVYGQSLFDLGELTEARAVFEQALGVDPENLVALRYMGDIAKRRGDPAAARRWDERVLEADPRNDAVASQLNTLTPTPPEPIPFRPPQEPGTRAVANASARRDDPLPESDDDPFAFPQTLPVAEPEAEFEEGLMAPVVWPDTADLVARRLTPKALPVFAMPADEDTIAAFGREPRDPPVPMALEPVQMVSPPADLAPAPAMAAHVQAPLPLPGGEEQMPDEGDVAIDAIFGDARTLREGGGLPVAEAPTAPARPHTGTPPERTPPLELEQASPAPSVGPTESLVPDDDEDSRLPAPPPSAFYTETMAELLLAQGYRARAIEVYEALVAQRPGDEPLRARLRAAREQADTVQRPRGKTDAAAPALHAGGPSTVLAPPPAPSPAVTAGTPVTARERLARLARPHTPGAAAPPQVAGRAAGWAADLPLREPLFTGPGRAADERVARQWAEALGDVPRTAGGEPNAFDLLWEREVATDEPSLEQYFALRTPPRPATALRDGGGAGGTTGHGTAGGGA